MFVFVILLILFPISFLLSLFVLLSLPKSATVFGFKILCKLLYRVKVYGLEHYKNLNENEGLIVVANHTSFLDGILLSSFVSKKLTFAVTSRYTSQWWSKLFLKHINFHAVDIKNPLLAKEIIELVKTGTQCVIFPEGRLTVTGSLMKVYEGPGMIADKANAKILPIRIDGTQYTHLSRLKNKVRLRLFPKITLTVLPPQNFAIAATIKGRKRREQISYKVYDVMTNLMFESANVHSTLFHALIAASKVQGSSKTLIVDLEERNNFRQLFARSFLLSKVLQKITPKNSAVGLLLPAGVHFVQTLFSVQLLNSVPVVLNAEWDQQQIIACCKRANIKTIIANQKIRSEIPLYQFFQNQIEFICIEDLFKAAIFSQKVIATISSLFPQFFYNSLYHPHKFANLPAVVLIEKDESDTERTISLQHQDLLKNINRINSVVAFLAMDIVFNCLQLDYFGISVAMLLPLLNGMKQYLYPENVSSRMVPELIYDSNATILFSTNTLLNEYSKFAHPYDFYNLRYIFSGRELITETNQKFWLDKFGHRLYQMFGCAEDLIVSMNTPMHYRVGSLGRLLPGINEIPLNPPLLKGEKHDEEPKAESISSEKTSTDFSPFSKGELRGILQINDAGFVTLADFKKINHQDDAEYTEEALT